MSFVSTAADDNTRISDPLGVNEPSVVLATFPDAILLTIEGDDDLAAEWRRLYPLDQRAQADDAAYQLAEFYGLPLRSDDCTHVQVIRG